MDGAIEIDDLKSQIRLQREGLQFMQSVANKALSTCGVSAKEFESIAKENGHTVVWKGSVTLVGPFEITNQDSCIKKMEQVGLYSTRK